MAERPDALTTALADLGRALDIGPDVDLVDGAVERIRSGSEGGATAGPRERPWVAAALLVAALATAVLAVPDSREAVARWLGFDTVRLRTTDRLPEAMERELDLGRRIDLDEAAALLDGHALSPPELGPPDDAFAGRPAGAVSLVWRARTGLPDVDGTGVGLVLTTIPGSVERVTFEKQLPPGTTVTQVDVDGAPGYWITGRPHAVVYLDADGNLATDTARLAGDTLLWTVEGSVHRLEADVGLDRALALARSLGPLPA
jgi:hypothetical protein